MKKLIIGVMVMAIISSLAIAPTVNADDVIVPDEGIFYIRNLATNKVLTPSANGVVQTTMTSAASQRWVVTYQDVGQNRYGDMYYIQSNSSTYPGYISTGDNISTSPYVCDTSLNGNLSYFVNFSASNTTLQMPSGLFLEVYPHSSANNAKVSITSGVTESNYQKWSIERVWYLRGDVNMDGSVDSTDVELIRQYNANGAEFDSCQMYLADLYDDGEVNAKDILYLRHLLNGDSGYNYSY